MASSNPSTIDELTPLWKAARIARVDGENFGDAKCLFGADKEAASLCAPCAWCQTLGGKLSWRLLASTFITHHLLKGFVAGGGDEGLLGKPLEFLLRAHNVPAGRMQALQAVATAPWVLKPVIGYISDIMPICGYKKAPYVIITTLISIVAVCLLGFQLVSKPSIIVVCLFFAFLQVASATLFVDAKQSEATKGNASLGPEFVTFTMVGVNVGMIMSLLIVGILIDNWGPHIAYIVALPFIASLLVPVCWNWLQEERLPSGKDSFSFSGACRSPCILTLSLLLVPLVAGLAIGSLRDFPRDVMLIIAIGAAATMTLSYLLFVRSEISGPIVFSFVLRLLSLHIDGALFYFYTNSVEEYPEGPHFSSFYYVSCLGCFAISGLIFGFCTGNRVLKEVSYRKSLFATVALRSCTQLLFLPMLLRWNVSYGVSDACYAPLVIFLDAVSCAWRHIPLSVLSLQATPLGLESSMCALNAGTVNLGIVLSYFLGGFMLEEMGIEPAGNPSESIEFVHLWKAQMVAALLPLLTLPCVPLLIPKAMQTEQLVVQNPTSATHRAPLTTCFPRWS